MGNHTKGKLKYALSTLDKQEFSVEDKDLLREFVNRLKAEGLSDIRIGDSLYYLIVFRKHLPCNFRLAEKKEIEDLMTWFNSQGYKATSRMMMAQALKRFYKWIRTGSISKDVSFPAEVSWIKLAIKKNEKREPEIFTESEVEKLIEAASCLRDKAFIAVIYENGFRIGEMLNMRLGDVEPFDFGFKIRVSGKTGSRTIPIIASAKLLSLYIENHPKKDDSRNFLWIHFGQRHRYGQLSYLGSLMMLRETAKRAGVVKRIYPHIFRHSAATRDAKFLTEQEMKIKFGWDRASEMASVYVHMSGRDLDQKLVSIYSGKMIEPPKPEFRPIICPRCNEKNTPGQRFCGRCGSPLNLEEVVKTGLEVEIMRQEYREIKELLSRLLADKSL